MCIFLYFNEEECFDKTWGIRIRVHLLTFMKQLIMDVQDHIDLLITDTHTLSFIAYTQTGYGLRMVRNTCY